MIHNINNPEAVVNIESADTVNITKARAVNLGGFVGVADPHVPSQWHEDEQAKFAQWTNDAIDASERAKEYQRGREDAAKNVEAVAEPFFLTRFNPIDEDAWEVFVNILAAARGDGEQYDTRT